MNKAQLIDAIASEAGLTKADAKKALDAFIKTTSSALKKGDRVALVVKKLQFLPKKLLNSKLEVN